MQDPEASFDAKSFAQLRPLVLRSNILAAVASFLALVVVSLSQSTSPFLFAYSVVTTLACYLTYRATNTRQLWLTDLLLVCTTTACLGTIAVEVDNADLWFLPIGLMMSLPVAAMHVRPLHALTTAVAVWGTLFYMVKPNFGQQLDLILSLMLIVSSILVAMLVCQTFCQIRRNVFDLQHQLHEMAYRDTLTRLPNRRAFMEALESVMHDARTETRLFFLMLDIDDFKRINDSHGHAVGDQVLVAVAQVLNKQSNDNICARLGGEEFAIAALLTDIAAAERLAGNIVAAINSEQLHGLSLSISIGLAECAPDEATLSLMRRADKALYDAKHNGKNRFTTAKGAEQIG